MKDLNGFLAAALEFAAVDMAIKEHMHKGLEEAAKKVEQTAKDEIGFYQSAIGPFPAWDELAESTEEQKAHHGYPSNAPLEATGEMRDSIKHECEGLEAIIGSDDEKLPWHEFGTDRMPPRPVLGSALERNKEFIVRIIGRYTVSAFVGGSRVHPSLGYDH